MTEIIQAVSTVGFPIACCCFLLWQNSKQDEYHRQQMEELRKTIEGCTKSNDELRAFTEKALDEMRGLVREMVQAVREMKGRD